MELIFDEVDDLRDVPRVPNQVEDDLFHFASICLFVLPSAKGLGEGGTLANIVWTEQEYARVFAALKALHKDPLQVTKGTDQWIVLRVTPQGP
jgi:hypothetical protein